MAIQIIDGFQVNIASPIDNRIVASGSTARNAIPYKYEGLRVFDLSNGIPYVWYNGAWVSENASGVAGVGTSASYIPLYTSTNIIGNSIMYQSTNKIGINTLSPGEMFEVVDGKIKVSGTGNFVGSGQEITNINASNISTGTLALNRLANGSTGWLLSGASGAPVYVNPSQITVGTSSVSSASAISVLPAFTTNYLTFVNSLSGNNALRVNSGLSYNPGNNTLTAGTVSLNRLIYSAQTIGTTAGNKFTLSNASSNISGATVNLETHFTRSSNGSSWYSVGSRIQMKVNDQYMGYIQFNGDNDTGVSFGTGYMSSDSTSNSYERMRIDISGRILMNSLSSISGGCVLHVKSTSSLYDGLVHQAWDNTYNIFEFKNSSGVQRGRIYGNGTSGVFYSTTSDRRLKTNIQDMPSMYDVIKNLKPSKFNWKIDNKEDYGFIAQDVFRVIPNLRGEVAYCDVNKEGFDIENPVKVDGEEYYYGLDYGKLTPFLTKALQETIEKLESLTDKIKNASSLEELKSSL